MTRQTAWHADRVQHLTRTSAANRAIEAARPQINPFFGTAEYPEGQTCYLQGTVWQRNNGRFFDRRAMTNLRRAQGILDAQAKRGERPLRSVNDGDVNGFKD